MMTRFVLLAMLTLAGALVHAQGVDPGAPDLLAIRDARVIVAPGKVLERATVVVRDGRIVVVAPDAAVPPGARVIDGKGATVHAAFLNAISDAGMPPSTEYPPATRGTRYKLATVRADQSALSLLKPDDAFAAMRNAGFGAALICPTVGLFPGASAVVSLSGETTEPSALAVRSDVFQHLAFQRDAIAPGYPGALMGLVAAARQTLSDVRSARSAVERYRRNPAAEPRPSAPSALLALEEVVTQKQPLAMRASGRREIERVLALAKEFRVRPVIDGGTEGWAVGDALKKAGAPVLLNVDLPALPTGDERPSLQTLRELALAPTTAAALHRAGVPFGFATAKPADYRTNVRKLVAAGLSPDAALEAATIGAARIVGVDRQLGTVEKGKIANLLVVRGGEDAFSEGALIEQTIIDGRLVGTPKASPGRPGPKPKPVKAPPTIGPGLVPPLPPSLPDTFVIRRATVWTSGPSGVLKETDVSVRGGRIVAVGPQLKVPAGTLEIDGRGKHLTPGMIDCHSHTAVSGGVNEGSNIVTAECRIEDVLNPDDVNIYRQLAGGTTAANILHGSANAIGGQNAVVKWRWGSDARGLLIDGAIPGIKFALGENPTRSNGSRASERYPSSRLGVERVIRSKFLEARAYAKRWEAFRKRRGPEPAQDFQLDAIVEILEGKRLVHCHSYRADEILMMVRLADEFGFRVGTFQHVLEGYKVADELAKHGAGGSTFSDWWGYKIEAIDAIPWNGSLMASRGVLTTFNSDSSELARRLNQEAGKAVAYGGTAPEEALKFVTINAAKQLRIDGRTGSIEVGKDADLALWSGDPLSPGSLCEKTFVDGRLLFDRGADLAARAALDEEAERLARELGFKAPDAADTKAPKPFPAPSRTADRPAPVGPFTALVGGTVHPVSSPEIPDAVVVFDKNGVITAVGPRASTPIPEGARVVETRGKHVYPGMIDAATTLGVNEIGSRGETQDYREAVPFSPELRIAVAVYPDAETIRVARAAGILNAMVLPAGGTLSGMATFLQLDGWTSEQMAIDPGAGMLLNFPGAPSPRRREDEELDCDDDDLAAGLQPPRRRPDGGATPPAESATPPADPTRALDAFMDEARRYAQARSADKDAPIDRDPRFEAMLPVLDGKVPILIRASREAEIRSAVLWAARQKLRAILIGALEADRCADFLKESGVPVVLPPTLALPRKTDAPYDDMMTLPGRLAAAGVRVVLSSDGAPHNVRRLPHIGATAAAFGWSKEAALRAITLDAAEVFGMGTRLGSVETGKWANLLVTDGDLFEMTTRVESAFVAGRSVDLTNRQTLLYDRWRARPRPE